MRTHLDIFSYDPFNLQWFHEALRTATKYLGEEDYLCGFIYYNTGLHYQERGELQEAYDKFKQSYLIEKEVLCFYQINYYIFSLKDSFFWALINMRTIESPHCTHLLQIKTTILTE